MISFSLNLKGAPKVRELTKLYRDISGDKKANVLPPIQWSGNVQEEETSDEQSEDEPPE